MNNQTKLSIVVERAQIISKLFIAWNVAVFIAALFMRNSIADDAVSAVFIRGAIYALGGGILLFLLSRMARNIRSSWQRLRIITALAPIGVIAFIVFTPHLPIWFDIAQIISGLLLVSIAVMIRGKKLHSYFPA